MSLQVILIKLPAKIEKLKQSRALRIIGIIFAIIAMLILGALNLWKDTHKDLQASTNDILKVIIAMDLGLSEDDSEELIAELSDEDIQRIDEILNNYTKGFGFIDKMQKINKNDDSIDDIKSVVNEIITQEDKETIQYIYKRGLKE